jgi:hypothetical protein
MAGAYKHEDVRAVPRGYRVRTVIAGDHRVRVAFPPGRKQTGSGVVVSVLHPRNENPGCLKRYANPELLLMSANPIGQRNKSLYDQFSRRDRLLLGRAGIGKKNITTEGDVREARRIISEMSRMKNRLPNPGGSSAALDSSEAAQARELHDEFTQRPRPSDSYEVLDEPHMAAGDYTDLGKLIALGVKPQPTGTTTYVQEISFPSKNIRVVCDSQGRQLFLVGNGMEIEEVDLRLFGADQANRCKVGVCRYIAYEATKWHDQLAESVRGESRVYEHTFGDEGGTPPELYYDRAMNRCLLEGGTYHVEGAGIVN